MFEIEEERRARRERERERERGKERGEMLERFEQRRHGNGRLPPFEGNVRRDGMKLRLGPTG